MIKGYRNQATALLRSAVVVSPARTVLLTRKGGAPEEYAYFGVGNVFIVDDPRPGGTLTTKSTFYGLGGKLWTDLELDADGWRT